MSDGSLIADYRIIHVQKFSITTIEFNPGGAQHEPSLSHWK